MAVVNNLNNTPENQQNSDQNNQQQQQGQNQADQFANKPVGVSGSSAAPSINSGASFNAAPTVGQGTSNNSNPTQSGRFTNLVNYLGANSDYNAQGGGLAGQVTNQFKGQANNIQGNFNNLQKDFNTQANNNYIGYDQGYVNSVLDNPTAYVSGATTYGQPPQQQQQPSDVVRIPEYGMDNPAQDNQLQPQYRYTIPENSTPQQIGDANLTAFQRMLNASYNGPTTTDTDGRVWNQAQTLSDTTNLTQSEPGRYALLSNMFGKPSYTSGAQSLDNLILQGNPSQLQGLQNSRSISSDLANNIQSGLVADQTLAGQYVQDANFARDQSRADLGGSINDFGKQAQQAAADAIKQRDTDYSRVNTGLSINQATDADAKAWGLTPGMTLYGVSPYGATPYGTRQYLTENQNAINQNNIISHEQQAKIDALTKLAGNYLSGDPTQVMQQFTGNQQAGTANLTPYSFNTNQFMNDVNNAKSDYLKSLAAPLYDKFENTGGDFWRGQHLKQVSPWEAIKTIQYGMDHPLTSADTGNENTGSYIPSSHFTNTIAALTKLLADQGLDVNGNGLGKGYGGTLNVTPAPTQGAPYSGEPGRFVPRHGPMIRPVSPG